MTRTNKIAFAAAAFAVLLALVSLLDTRGLPRLRKLRAEIAGYEGRNRDLARENAALRREVQALSGQGDAKALERAAREDLGLVRPNEVIFNFER